jgi:hypothetical protein
MAYIQLISGIRFNIEDPEEDTIRIQDIAHALGNICRFGGHAKKFYSVAQHCVYASYMTPGPHQMAALLHDATEAYLGDVVRPLKRLLPDYERLEKNLAARIAHNFGLPIDAFEHEHVKHVDNMLQAYEAKEVCTNPSLVLSDLELFPDTGIRDFDPNFSFWEPAMARDRFLWRFHSIISEQNAGEAWAS